MGCDIGRLGPAFPSSEEYFEAMAVLHESGVHGRRLVIIGMFVGHLNLQISELERKIKILNEKAGHE